MLLLVQILYLLQLISLIQFNIIMIPKLIWYVRNSDFSSGYTESWEPGNRGVLCGWPWTGPLPSRGQAAALSSRRVTAQGDTKASTRRFRMRAVWEQEKGLQGSGSHSTSWRPDKTEGHMDTRHRTELGRWTELGRSGLQWIAYPLWHFVVSISPLKSHLCS